MSISWKKPAVIACITAVALSGCTEKKAGKPGANEQSMPTARLLPDREPDRSLILESDGVGCKYAPVIQLKLDGSQKGFDGSIIDVSQQKDHIRIEWNGEVAHALVVNGKKWVFLRGMKGVTLLYKQEWGPIDSLLLCSDEK